MRPKVDHFVTVSVEDLEPLGIPIRYTTTVHLTSKRNKRRFVVALERLMRQASAWPSRKPAR